MLLRCNATKNYRAHRDAESEYGEEHHHEGNMVIFDETIIDDCARTLLVVGESRNSGGGNINTVQTCDRTLGTYIPFSMPTVIHPTMFSFSDTINQKKSNVPSLHLMQSSDIWLCKHPHMLFLADDTGYLTKERFVYIMEKFSKW